MMAVALALLLVFMALAIPVAVSVGVLGITLEQIFSPLPLIRAMGEVSWSASNEFLLVSVPMFILLGEILLRSGFAERMYAALINWVSWLPGRAHALEHRGVRRVRGHLGLERRHRGNRRNGCPARGPALRLQRAHLSGHARRRRNARDPHPAFDQHDHLRGADERVGAEALSRRHHSGLGVGAAVHGDDPVAVRAEARLGRARVAASWAARIAGLVHLLPPIGIFMLVVGSIYAGIATPTEAASLGVLARSASPGGPASFRSRC